MWLALVLPAIGLDFATLFTGKHYGQPADAQAMRTERAGMWLAWSMVGLMLFLALFIGMLVWRFRKLSRNPDPGLVLMDEIYQEALAEKQGKDHQPSPIVNQPKPAEEATNQAWEKPGDWWQKEKDS